jgi:hypothetical protein
MVLLSLVAHRRSSSPSLAKKSQDPLQSFWQPWPQHCVLTCRGFVVSLRPCDSSGIAARVDLALEGRGHGCRMEHPLLVQHIYLNVRRAFEFQCISQVCGLFMYRPHFVAANMIMYMVIGPRQRAKAMTPVGTPSGHRPGHQRGIGASAGTRVRHRAGH